VVLPSIFPGIEQGNQLTQRGQRCYVRTFVSIADHSRAGKVIQSLVASVLPADDVINLVRKDAVSFLEQAILTTEVCPANDFGAQFRRELQERPARISCALALAKPRICSSRT